MSPARVVFVHGSGRAGAAAWPLQVGWPDAAFLCRPGFGPGEDPEVTDFAREAARVNDACGDGAHVVASSYGAIAALGAAALPDSGVRSLVLAEPAAFSLGRGGEAVEAHISAVDPVLRRAATLSPEDFQVALLTAFGVPNPPVPTTPEQRLGAARLRLHRAPWDAPLDPGVVGRVPTLVVTGDWNAEYEELARALVGLGARHVQVRGFGHAVQESPAFDAILREFWSTLHPPGQTTVPSRTIR
jgi:pimeloyl-ACP methyl ester carboxylesterase